MKPVKEVTYFRLFQCLTYPILQIIDILQKLYLYEAKSTKIPEGAKELYKNDNVKQNVLTIYSSRT